MGNMFSSDAIGKALKDNAEEQKKIKQKQLPRGFHILELVDVKLDKSKHGDPMFVLSIKKGDDPKEEFRGISEYLVIQENGLTTKTGVNFNVYTLVTFFLNAFKIELKEPSTDDPYGDIEKQFKKAEGKKFRGIISHKVELVRNKDGQATGKTRISSNLDFRRSTGLDDMSLSEKTVDPKDLFTDLSPKEKSILKGDTAQSTGSKPSGDAHGVPTITDGSDVDDLPF